MTFLRVLCSTVVITAAVLVSASAAQAATLSGDIAMYSDPGDYIGGGTQQVLSDANATFTVQGDAGDLTIDVSSNQGDDWTLQFAAPPGETLQPGVYDGIGRASFRGSGQPGMDISGDGRGCNTDTGRFEVKDIATDSSGAIDRLWIIYEQHCEGAVPALFGEVRLGEPATDPDVTPIASLVRWPANNLGTPETTVPVQFLASAPVSLSGASVSGDDPSDFVIRSDGCSGESLAAGDACDVYVRFTPTSPGLQTATLSLLASDGVTEDVPLEGWTYGGTTRVVMSSATGDWVGDGQEYEFDPTNSLISAWGTPEAFNFEVQAGGDIWWYGDFAPPQGDILAPGSSFTGAQSYSSPGVAPGISIYGDGRGCDNYTGEFKVLSATYTPDGQMQTFAVSFDQNCDGDSGDLTGEFDWRLGDTTPLAPWMAQTPPDSPPPSSSSTSGTAGGSSGGNQSAGGDGGSAQVSGSPPGGGGGGGSASGGTGTCGAGASTAATRSHIAAIPSSFGAAPTCETVVAGLLAVSDRLSEDEQRTSTGVASLREHSTNQRHRVGAVRDLRRLHADLASSLRLLHTYHAEAGEVEIRWREVIVTLGQWELALEREQTALGASTKHTRAASLQAASRAAGSVTLRAIALLERTIVLG